MPWSLKTLVLAGVNLFLIGLFVFLLRKKELLSYHHQGRLWLTWLSVVIITLMDELTSVFYAPAQAYRFIGPSAILFIALTSVFVRFVSTRLVEIANILEHHGLIGGGVYSFSYLVLGPLVSIIAVASIMVDYILTACISAVSAVSNAAFFLPLSHSNSLVLVLATILGRSRVEHYGYPGKRPGHLPHLHGGGLGHPEPHRFRSSLFGRCRFGADEGWSS